MDPWYKRRHSNLNIADFAVFVVGEGGDVDQDVVRHWTENVLPSILKDYDENDIYNADETGLFFTVNQTRRFISAENDASVENSPRSESRFLYARICQGQARQSFLSLESQQNRVASRM